MVKIFIHILRLKEIPKLYWSSPFEYNLKPKNPTIKSPAKRPLQLIDKPKNLINNSKERNKNTSNYF